MSVKVLCTDSKPGFITSDNPVTVVHFDPRPSGLASPNVQITVPLSPKQLLFINHNQECKQLMDSVQYSNIEESWVHEFNKHTNANSKTWITVNQSYTNPSWFYKDNI
jgi:hypothetical protein